MEVLIQMQPRKSAPGDWTAWIPALPVTMAHGKTQEEALAGAMEQALHFLAYKLKRGNITGEEALAITFRLCRPEEHQEMGQGVDWPNTVGWKGDAKEKEAAE